AEPGTTAFGATAARRPLAAADTLYGAGRSRQASGRCLQLVTQLPASDVHWNCARHAVDRLGVCDLGPAAGCISMGLEPVEHRRGAYRVYAAVHRVSR